MARHVDIERLSKQLQSISECAKKLESDYAEDLDAVHPEFRDSARNLVHYLALRQSDISELQEDLAALGLSSLGRAERNVMGRSTLSGAPCRNSPAMPDTTRTWKARL